MSADPTSQLLTARAMSAASKADSLGMLLKKNDFLSLTPMNRIHCSITKHDIQPNADAVRAHLNSKAFRRAKLYSGDFDQFLPYIVPHKYSDKKMYCTITKKTMNRILAQVERHVNGRKFKRLKAEFEEKKARREARAKRKAEKAARYAERQRRKENGEVESGDDDVFSSDDSSSSDDGSDDDSDNDRHNAEHEESGQSAESNSKGRSDEAATESGDNGPRNKRMRKK